MSGQIVHKFRRQVSAKFPEVLTTECVSILLTYNSFLLYFTNTKFRKPPSFLSRGANISVEQHNISNYKLYHHRRIREPAGFFQTVFSEGLLICLSFFSMMHKYNIAFRLFGTFFPETIN